MKPVDFNVLVIDDQPSSMDVFLRRFENHDIDVDGVHFQAFYSFLSIKLKQLPENGGRWTIDNGSIDRLAEIYNTLPIHLVVIDFAFIPPEVDEELTYKLTRQEIATPKDLIGSYVVDASQLYISLFERHPKVKSKAISQDVLYLLYTYPSDNLMHLLGDAAQRRNKMSRVLKAEIRVLDTRQLLYGGDKELETHHDRRLYPQLLGSHLNSIIKIIMQERIISRIPQYKSIKLRRSVLAVTMVAAFAGGVAFLADKLTEAIIKAWAENFSLSVVLIVAMMLFVFVAGSFFAVAFERIVRNIINWTEDKE